MEPDLLQFSIVVRGESHNPTVLNPDFLAIQGIIPHAWGWKVQQKVITTPMVAMVEYANGVSLQVQPETLQVADTSPDTDPKRSKIPEIIRGYVNTLPHVRYIGLGINFKSAVIVNAPAKTIRDRFLKAGPWSAKRNLVGAGVRLVYPLEKVGRVLLSVDGGTIQQRGKNNKPVSKDAILINSNFHRDLGNHPATQEISTYLDGVERDWNMHEELLSTVLQSKE